VTAVAAAAAIALCWQPHSITAAGVRQSLGRTLHACTHCCWCVALKCSMRFKEVRMVVLGLSSGVTL
jgi:hypothetical protein